ncbi:unnamed protein product [Amoebophrya sp. A25]|nr:unnamed protein product [Amoebophrya sp. A25]|eukprot:GSA25T00002618001.1
MVLRELSVSLTASFRKFGARQSAQAVAEVDQLLEEMGNALLAADVSVPYVQLLRKNIRQEVLDENAILENYGVRGGFTKLGSQQKVRILQRGVVKHLSDLLRGDREPFAPQKNVTGQVLLFVGLQGSGKTTSITKYAHYYKMKGFRVALVCADTFRAGAFDQLKQNASKIRCPFYGSYTETDPVVIAEEGVRFFREEGNKYDLILVDSSGRHRQEAALLEEMQQLYEAVQPVSGVILVMDSHIGQAGFRQAESFAEAVDVGSVILTKMDDSSGTKNKGGGALSAVAATGAPVIFLGTGEHFEDFEKFSADGFVSKLLGLGDVRGLVDELSQNMIDVERLKSLGEESADGRVDVSKLQDCFKGEHKNLIGNILDGKFTLRNLYEMFQSMNGMGPMGSLMNMMPGMMNMMQQGVDKKAAADRVKRLIVMMDSMTDEEMDGLVDVKNSASRRLRIMRGSGCKSEQELLHLFTEHARIADMVEKMGGSIDLNNPMAMMQNMQKMLTPDMKKQMQSMLGGAGGMGGMVEQMMESMGMGKMPPGMVDSMLGSMFGGGDNTGGMPGLPPGMPPGMFNALPSSTSSDNSGISPALQVHTPKVSAGGGPTPASSSSSSAVLVLRPQTEVKIQGLKSRPAENGKVGKILGYDEAKGRYMVGNIAGLEQPLALKPANFCQTKVRVLSSSSEPSNRGETTIITTTTTSGENNTSGSNTSASSGSNTNTTGSPKKTPAGGGSGSPSSAGGETPKASSSKSRLWEVLGFGSSSSSSDKDLGQEHGVLSSLQEFTFRARNEESGSLVEDASLVGSAFVLGEGQAVRVHSLQSEKGRAWNECYGTIMGYDTTTGRYAVDMGDAGKTQLKIKLANMML